MLNCIRDKLYKQTINIKVRTSKNNNTLIRENIIVINKPIKS